MPALAADTRVQRWAHTSSVFPVGLLATAVLDVVCLIDGASLFADVAVSLFVAA